MDTPLFDPPPSRYRAATSQARARRLRDDFLIDLGYHPLSRVVRAGLPLHPDRTLTCGGCANLRRLTTDGGPRTPPWKCWADSGVRVTAGDATTVRRSWPACTTYEEVPCDPPTPVTGADPQ